MACELSMLCDLVYRFLKCALPEDTRDMHLKVCTLNGIHKFKKDSKSQTPKCSPWRPEAQPYPSLKKKIVEFIHQRQALTTPYASRPNHPKSKKTPKKRNSVPLTKPDKSKLSKPRKINVQKYLTSTSQLNWKPATSKSLTKEAIDAAWSTSTSLAPCKECQLMNIPSTPLPCSPTDTTKVAEDSKYCAICTPLGKDCPGRLGLSSDWDEEDDQAEDKDQKQSEASPDIFIMPTRTLKPSKPYITKYFYSMSSDTTIICSPKEKWRCNIIVA